MRSVVLLSGGLDSAANLAFCSEQDQPVLALTVNYGQRAAEREIAAAHALCDYYGVKNEVVDLRWLGAMGGSALTDAGQAMPQLGRGELDDLKVIEPSARSVWVPNRNGVMIQVAAAYAERMDCSRVVVGFNREEAATFPDNSIEFLKRSTVALEYSTRNHVQVFSYTAELDKREIVRKLASLSRAFPFESVWSCYEGGARPCGRCESCQRQSRAFEVRS